jgi:hypothetical protein
MDKALAIAESSALGLLTLITGASPPEVIRELLLPPLDLDMPVPVSKTHSEPSTVRNLPHPIHTQLTTDGTLSDGSESPPSIYDPSVIPPTHDFRTLVLCFDGTGDQFDADVRPQFLFRGVLVAPLLTERRCARRIRTSWSFSRCSRRTTRVSSWFTIRFAVLDLPSCHVGV